MRASDEAPRSEPQPGVEPGLWLVATPIGNLGDISQRALSVLASVDRVACEDTRRTGRLLSRHGVEARLVSYHEHNAARVRPTLIRLLSEGGSVALVADAGTPLISDPGYKLVRAALDAGIRVTGCPGPSAPLLALVLSGLPTDRFYFGGFLPARAKARRRETLAKLKVARCHAGLLRIAPPAGRVAGGHGGSARPATGCDGPRADQAARGDAARNARQTGSALR